VHWVGYLGRSELPEGLKALFRPITVMVPDLVLICENMLMAEGFTQAKTLASKFYGLYSLLRDLLSKQLHYDWGLRAVKSVLVVAGGFKRQEPDLMEEALLMRALRDFNTPKIVREDEVVFFGLMGDLFPGINPPRKVNPALEEHVLMACENLGNHPDEFFRLKVVQLEELLEIRHCVFVMGPPGAGKSQAWKTLGEARTIRGDKTKYVDINPKSVKTEELYGFISMATREWKDGLLSKVMRDLGEIPDEKPKWIILDGDLDANWIESMNSVMDDNKMLTLASNERIPLKPHMRLIFEIRDLRFATPATVSRAGILYISTDDGTQWNSLIQSWLRKLTCPETAKEQLATCFTTYVKPTLKWMAKHVGPIVSLQDMNFVQTLLFMLDGILTPQFLESDQKDCIEKAFCFAMIWSMGSALTITDDGTDNRKLFSDWWRSEWRNVKLPTQYTVFDYWYDATANTFEQWSKSPYLSADMMEYDSSTPMASVTVPTPETCSVTYWMKILVNMRRPVMLAGPSGTGKTQIVNGMLTAFDPQDFMSCNINFNFYTTSAVLMNTMGIPLVKKTGTNYGPPGQAKLIYFVDDINLPEVDKYDTQSGIALLRQHLEYEHVYDLSKLTVKNINNTQLVACMNPTAGSFEINPRLQRWFATFAIGLPETMSLHTIYLTFLTGHLKRFDEEIQGIAKDLVRAAVSLHREVMQNFRKTAQNFHYEFNIRHISNVFTGLLVSQPDQFKSTEKFVYLWLHESERVYGDRLVSYEDLAKYNIIVQAQHKKVFPNYNITRFYSGERADPLVFCHFAENVQDKVYEMVSSIGKMSHVLEDALREYNEINATMDLVLFEDAMKHIARIVRVVMNSGGHALLVGVGGSGKQSLSRLSAFICGYVVKQIVISSTYGLNDLKEDLKWMYNKAGLKEEGVMFLLTDSQITNERFLVFINDLLASGNIPDLFAGDEVDGIINAVTNKVKALGQVPDRNNCWEYFLVQIRKNLHVVLAFSPVGDAFRTRARKFPALVNCTVIDWFQPWPHEALFSVGRKFIAGIELGSQGIRSAIEAFLPYSFTNVNQMANKFRQVERRHVYTTPKSYLELLKLYNTLLDTKRKNADFAIDRLSNGLQKLRETATAVTQIEADLKISLEEADQKRTVAEGIAEVVSKEKAVVEVETAKAQVQAKEVAVIQEEVMEKQRSTEEDLSKAEPMVEAAMAALNTLDKKELGEAKTMLKPPAGVDDVFAATMVLLAGLHPNVIVQKNGKVKDKSWDACKKQLLGSIPEYIEYLKKIKLAVDDQTIPKLNFVEVKQLTELEHFKVEVIKTKNSAAGGLCSFVLNIVMYYEVVVTVEPKRRALAEANEQLSTANAQLKMVTEMVAELEAKLAKLTTELNAANKEKQEALDAVDRGQRKLDLAQRLTNALASENVRWAENILTMEADKELLTGDVLLASAFISYVGPFTKVFRDKLMTQTFSPFLTDAFTKAVGAGSPIPLSPAADPLKILTNAAEIAKWGADGLPADQVSVENGAIVCNSARWPLIIDPQLQGIKWIRQKESGADRNLQVVRLGQNDLLRKLEKALEEGWTLFIENIGETIDAVLNPVVQRAVIKRGKKMYVKLGDTEVEFHKNFRLFLHTKLSNPHYPPEIQAECTLINFTVTMIGLEDQLLSLVVRKERLDLATLSEDLVKQQNDFTIKIKELEDNILYKLATAQGDITEDVELIEGLETTKKIANEIAVKQEAAKQTQVIIKTTSEKYRSVANRSSLLFFLMNDLVKMHTYYIYSLEAFTTVFYRGIDNVTSEPVEVEGEEKHEATDAELATRCTVLTESITRTVFNYIRRGLFEVDKLTVATLLTLRIATNDGKLSDEDLAFLVENKQSPDPGNMGPLHEWLPASIWPKIKAIENMKRFASLGDNMQSDSEQWQKWFDSEMPESAKLPGDYQKALDSFDRLILLRAMRPDRVTTALRAWIEETMGKDYVFQKPFDMPATYLETSSQIPTFFVLFAGVDPTPWVESLGREKGITFENGNFKNISMGQGQEKPAEAVVEQYAKSGGWVMLQNCHLMQSWVPRLERLLEVVQEDAHPDFRCFISAEPPPISSWKNMPESLMQSAVKVANEAPADIKSNINRGWANFSHERIENCTKKNDFKACLFSLCWFHSIVLGRRRFGQQGWSRKYSFNTGDLTICANVLESYLEANPVIPWDDIRYIFGEIMYGGHITDAWDRRTCNSYLSVLVNDKLFNGMELGPGFKSPDPSTLDYEGYLAYVDEKLPQDSPTMFGLHPNAEIGYLTNWTAAIFDTILQMGGGDGGGGGRSSGALKESMDYLSKNTPENFQMITIMDNAAPLLLQESGPFVVVALQECQRMNGLLSEIKRSLIELDKGMKGQLNMSQPMEDLMTAISINQWPGRNIFSACRWESKAWPSNKNLLSQFADMLNRVKQLVAWSSNLITPYSVWLPGLFNPTSYLTAVMQVTARRTGMPLDQMTTETHITTFLKPDMVDYYPEDGAFVHGFYIEGARWPTGDELGDPVMVTGTPCGGNLVDGRLKELLPSLPVVYVKAVAVQKSWEPSAVGYLRRVPDIYECPCYLTSFRGPTYVFLATLKTVDPCSKWVLTGTAILMQTDS
jgi:dynein heavy chain